MGYSGWGEPTHTLIPWKEGFSHPIKCIGWFAQIGLQSTIVDADDARK